MQFGDFFFDGDKRKIYEAPSGFSYALDGNGYRIYTPDDIPSAPVQLIYSTYELWSRSVDFLESSQWARLIFSLAGGAYRYTDQFNEDKYSLIDIRFINDWAYVPANYKHNTYIRGNCFPNKATNIDFDTSRISAEGVSPRIFFSDAGERSVADADAQAVANASLVYASFAGSVWLDSIGGANSIGTDTEPNGNQERPVLTAPLALAVCLNRGFKSINLLEDYDFVAGDNISNKKIKGVTHIATHVDIGYDAECTRAVFDDLHVTGVLDGNSEINNCVVGDIVYFYGHIHDSALEGTLYLGGSHPAKLLNCSMSRIDKPVEIDCGGSGQDAIIDYRGMITISNLTGANTIGITMGGGIVTIASDCTAGTIIIQGNFELIDNSGEGCTVIYGEKLLVRNDIPLIGDAVGDFNMSCP